MLQPKYTCWCGTVASKWCNTLRAAKFSPLRVNIHIWYINGQNHKTTNVQTDRYDDYEGKYIINTGEYLNVSACLVTCFSSKPLKPVQYILYIWIFNNKITKSAFTKCRPFKLCKSLI